IPPVTGWAVCSPVVFGGDRVIGAVFFPEGNVRQGSAGVHEVLEHVPQGVTFFGVGFADQGADGNQEVAVPVGQVQCVHHPAAVDQFVGGVGVEFVKRR